MRKFVLFCCLIVASFLNQLCAQTDADWQWATQFRTETNNCKIEALPDGQFYYATTMAYFADVGGDTLYSNGPAVLISLRTADGKTVWAQRFQTDDPSGITGVSDITTDSEANVYITGYYTSSLTIGRTKLTLPTDFTIASYLIKMRPDGTIVWVKCIADTTKVSVTSYAWNIELDNLGNIYIGGGWYKTSPHPHFFFISRYSPQGELVWTETAQWAPAGYSSIKHLSVIGPDELYVTGEFSGADLVLGQYTLTADQRRTPPFVARFNRKDGVPNWLWGYKISTTGFSNSTILGLIQTERGPVLAGGFGKDLIYRNTTITSQVSTAQTNSYFVLQLDKGTGNLLWESHSNTNRESNVYTIKADKMGNIYAGGMFRWGTFQAGTQTLSHYGDHFDAFVLRFNSLGQIIWATPIEEENGEYNDLPMHVFVNGISLTSDNDIILAGTAFGTDPETVPTGIPIKLWFGNTLLEGRKDIMNFFAKFTNPFPYELNLRTRFEEQYTAQEQVNITWASKGVTNVLLEYTTNNWATKTAVGTYSSTLGDEGITITIPNIHTQQFYIRITDVDNSNSYDQNDLPISIIPILKLTNPVGGEQLLGRDPLKLYWNSHSSITNVRIEFTTDGWATKTLMGVFPASNGKDGVLTTIVPNVATNNYHIRISDAANPIISSENTVPMTITPFVITVTSPNGGEMLLGGTQHTIKWNSNNNNQVYRADYSTDNGTTWQPIFANSQNTATSYLWTVPSDVLSRNCKVRITTFYGSGVQDVSDANFSILPLVFTKRPDAGQELAKGTPYEIQWIGSPGVTGVQLFYSSDNGANWQMLADNLPSSGTYIWNVPNIMNATSRLRIQAKNNLSWQADSDIFNIGPAFYITYPSGGESFNSSTTQTIRWKANSNNMVNISYLHPNGQYIRINSAPIDSRLGSINWVIPTGFSNASCRILIQDVNKPELWHVTNPFCVIGTAGITSIAFTSGLQLYPNPANNNVNIQAEGFNGQIASIKVFSMQNPSVPVRVISMVPLVKGVLKYSVDVSALKPGHYIVEVQCNDKKQSQKFEKQ